MYSSDQSVSYLDLGGNLVIWAGDGSTVVLHGYHFHEFITLLTLVICSLCLAALIVIIIWLAGVYLSQKRTRRMLRWYGVCLSALSMSCYFSLDIVNRILHELEFEFASYYVAIDIPMSKLASLGELLLLFALLLHLSPTLEENFSLDLRSTWVKWAETCLVILVALFNLVGGFLYIYNFVAYNLSPPPPGGFGSSDSTFARVLRSYPWVNVTLYALYLLGAISFAIHCLLAIQAYERADTLCKALRINVPLLAASFFSRSLVSFVYAMVFGLSSRWANYTEQLIYMAFYGPLTVTIYMSIIRIAAAEEHGSTTATYAPVEQVVSKEWVGWQQQKLGYGFADETPPVTHYSILSSN